MPCSDRSKQDLIHKNTQWYNFNSFIPNIGFMKFSCASYSHVHIHRLTDTQFKLDAIDKDPYALDSLARPLPFRG